MIESEKKEILKISRFAIAIVVIVSLVCKIPALQALDPRNHSFAGAGNIVDEGFRWRNNFDFTVTSPPIVGFGALANTPILPVNWRFDNGGNIFGGAIGFNQGGNANAIHQRLSAIVNGGLAVVPGRIGLTHMAAAAITIVVRNPNNGNLEAYSQVLRDNGPGGIMNSPAVSVPSTDINNNLIVGALNNANLSMYYGRAKYPNSTNSDVGVREHLTGLANDLLAARILSQGNHIYGCCEGQIIARLFDTNPPTIPGLLPVPLSPLFPQAVQNLVAEADAQRQAAAQVNVINANNIILVVLHIHSRKDPCAKCSKALSGLSKQMNASAANPALQTTAMTAFLNGELCTTLPRHAIVPPVPNIPNQQLITNLRLGNARFLIEISSDVCYHLNGPCSNAEIAGQDGAVLAAPIDININGVPINFAGLVGGGVPPHQLGIPNNNGINNWFFPATFPPYVIYGRVNAGAIINPPACACGNAIHAVQPALNPVP